MPFILEDYNNDDYEFCFVHQHDERPFNRGALKNIGFMYYRDKYPDNQSCIDLLCENLNEERTQIYENSNSSEYTSYSVNKGEEIVFCLKSRKDPYNLHDINLMMYVAIHELAHIGCHEIGHTDLFKKIFAFYLEVAIE